MSLGDFDSGAVIYGKFTTFNPSTGAPFTLGGSPVLSVYKDDSAGETTTGVTLTADFDSKTGLNHFAIDTSNAFYSAGSFFDIVITTGTVNAVSAVGSVVGRFTIRKTAALKPTTAGRTLDVSSGGEAGIDLANVGSPTQTLNLSGTTISTSQVVASVSGSVGSVAGNVGGNVVGSVASVTAGVTVGTNNDKTGYTLTQAFPTNFASLDINASGHISRVTLVDTTTTNTDMRGTDGAALASAWTSTRAAYLDSVLLAVNNNRTVQVTGSHRVAADMHESQPGAIHATTFEAGAIDATALAADAANEIADALLDRADAIETGLTLRGAIRLDTAALAGKLSGAAGTTVTIRNVGDTKARITATVDADGNRSAVTTDAT